MDHQSLVETLIANLGFESAEIALNHTDESIEITITLPEDESGMLIGYHGEKVDALQLIVSQMLNKNQAEYKPVQIDVNGYRQRRREALHELADKAAAKALESGREILLPPLPAGERRVIHMHLQDNPEVSTYSEGEDSGRRVVIRPNTHAE